MSFTGTIKEKTTGEIFKILRFSEFGSYLSNWEEVNFYLPAGFYFMRDNNLDVVYDSKEEKFYDIDEDTFILKGGDEKIIVSDDNQWLEDNFLVFDPFLEMASSFTEDKTEMARLVDSIDDTLKVGYQKGYQGEKYEKIKYCLRTFDFKEAAKMFKTLNWTWGIASDERVPDETELKYSEYRRVICEFFSQKRNFQKEGKYKETHSSTGRFEVITHTYDDDSDFRIILNLTPLNSW